MFETILANVIVALLIADFITGLFHWLEDTYCTWNMPGFLGSQICDPNLLHHKDQMAFTESGFWSRNYIQICMALPFVLAFWFINIPVLALAAALSSLGNEIHYRAHTKQKGALKMLQDMGVLQDPRQHAGHHKAPYDKAYCTLTNWLNPPLDALGFWRALEDLIACTGLKSKRAANNKELQNVKQNSRAT